MINRRYVMPSLDLFPTFEAAARTLNFTKAAEELFITQSAVSKQLKVLEQQLGVSLFERRARALTLTDAGRALLGPVSKPWTACSRPPIMCSGRNAEPD